LDEALGRYGVVSLPSLYLLAQDGDADLVLYVDERGTLIVSFRPGIADEPGAVDYVAPRNAAPPHGRNATTPMGHHVPAARPLDVECRT
jgi:beta-galactosidase GanA